MQSSTTAPGALRRIGTFLTTVRNLVLNLLFLLVIIAVGLTMLAQCTPTTLKPGTALLLNPVGAVVEARSLPGGLTDFLTGGPSVNEVELESILSAIRRAATDERINALILDIDELNYVSPAHASRIGHTLEVFKTSGKEVLAYGHYYSQEQYHIASFADALYMHPLGQVILEGYGNYNLFYDQLLDKLGVKVHEFRAGEYKSALEPLTRSDMSEESRLAYESVYGDLWQHFVANVARNRAIAPHDVQTYANEIAELAQSVKGDLARMALENHLVDELLTPDQALVRLSDSTGGLSDQGDLKAIDFATYLNATDPQDSAADAKIAVLVAQGPIVLDGPPRRVASAEILARQIREARLDPNVRALVLRVDSPGGSQFASELIRQELELMQLSGTPVVASFASVAASGGYWIASTADRIVSEATTITGSIGIFSYLMTYEDTLAKVGVFADGVSTTDHTFGLNPFTGVNAAMSRVMQSRIEHGYEQFVNLVAKGRGLPIEAAYEAAEGRIWSGEAALELKLVDHLGGLDTALAQAAELAGLDAWEVVPIVEPLDPRSAFLAQMLGGMGVSIETSRVWSALQDTVEQLLRVRDPNALYALCAPCWQFSAQRPPLFTLAQ